MLHDIGSCIFCGCRFQYENPVEIGFVDECPQCESQITIGLFVGTHYDNFLVRKVKPPSCPKCNSTNTLCGMKIEIGFAGPDLYLRQCEECHTVWQGNHWWTESVYAPNPNPEWLEK